MSTVMEIAGYVYEVLPENILKKKLFPIKKFKWPVEINRFSEM